MFRRIIAGLVVSIWLGVLGVEMCEDLGLFTFANEQADQAADNAIESLGQAITAVDHPYFSIAKHWPSRLVVFQFSDGSPSFEPQALSLKHGLIFTAPKQPFYKLYLDLRI
jgi:hypothetical protein